VLLICDSVDKVLTRPVRLEGGLEIRYFFDWLERSERFNSIGVSLILHNKELG